MYPGVGLGVGWCESGYVFSESRGAADYDGPEPIPLAYCKALCDAAPSCAGFDFAVDGWECRGYSTVEPEDGCYPNPNYNVYVVDVTPETPDPNQPDPIQPDGPLTPLVSFCSTAIVVPRINTGFV